MLLYRSERFQAHATGGHPEQRERLIAIDRMLEATGWPARVTEPTWTPATRPQLRTVHDEAYLAKLDAIAASGGGYWGLDTVISPASPAAAADAAGAVFDAVGRVIAGEDRRAFLAVRPPGHHALPDQAMGFCLYANAALAAEAALAAGLDRVMVVDFDVHHGNGTQDIFYDRERVGFVSLHRSPFWPGSGGEDETGTGPGLGTTLNRPITFGTDRDTILGRWAEAVAAMGRRMRPDLVILSAGFDAHENDPVGSLNLIEDDFGPLTRAVVEVANEYAGGRVVSLLEGGYDLVALAGSVDVHLTALAEP